MKCPKCGTEVESAYFAELGKRGGASKSPAKLAAIAKNAKLGGWPKGRPRKPEGKFSEISSWPKGEVYIPKIPIGDDDKAIICALESTMEGIDYYDSGREQKDKGKPRKS